MAIEDLTLSEKQAEQIIEKGIVYGAYDGDEVPGTKKEKLAAADEIIAYSLDAYIGDEIRPGDDDPEVAKAGKEIEEVFAIAGIVIEEDDDGTLTAVAGEPDEDEAEGDDNEGDEGDEDEAPFDPDDFITGYTELSVMTKLKKVKALDPKDDDDIAVLAALADWENEQEKPSSRVLNYIDEVLPPEDEAEADEQEADEPEDDAENGDEPDTGEEALDQPWDADKESGIKAYDDMSATDIKTFLKEVSDADELTVDQVEYVLEYEEARKAPRKRVIDYCNALLAEFSNGGDTDDAADDAEPEAEAEPETPKRGPGRPKKAPAADSNGVITITREQILEALEAGSVSISIG